MIVLNKKGASNIIVAIVTAIVTAIICYIIFQLFEYSRTLNGTEIILNKPESTDSSTTLKNKVEKVKSLIDNSFLYDHDEQKLTDGAIRGMLASLDDPYAAYYNESEFKSFYAQTEGEYVGIGIYVAYDKIEGMPIVLTPLDDSPAKEAGLLPGDYITYVDDKKSVDYSYEEIIDAIKGVAGTKTKIGVLREKEDESLEEIEFEVVRKKIDLSPIESRVLNDQIGYIKLSSFDENSFKEFCTKFLPFMTDPKIKGVILDIRNNPGGVLSICAAITDLLVPSGDIVYTLDKSGKKETITSDEKCISMPFVVLVNKNSASASEILTAAVKDHGVGTIVGEKTFGKGVVQTLIPIYDGTYMKFTTQEYFSPKGNKINGDGVTPDIEVKLPENVKSIYNVNFEDDTQLKAAITEIEKKIKE